MLKIFFFKEINFSFRFVRINWFISFYYIFFQIVHVFLEELDLIFGYFIDYEGFYFFKNFFNTLGNNRFSFSNYNFNYNIDFQKNFLFNITLLKLEEIKVLFLIGSNLRLELPILNVRFRRKKNYIYDLKFFSFGLGVNYLNFYIKNSSNCFNKFFRVLEGKNKISRFLIRNFVINFIINFIVFFNLKIDIFFIIKNYFLYNFYQKFSFNFLHSDSNKCNSLNGYFNTNFFKKDLNLNFLKKEKRKKSYFKLKLILGRKTFFLKKNIFKFFKDKEIIKTSFGDKDLLLSDLVLPSKLFTEGNFLYFNFEGICQFLNKAVNSPGSSKRVISFGKALFSYFLNNYYFIFFKIKKYIYFFISISY